MGKQERGLLWWALFDMILLSGIYGSRGADMSPSPEPFFGFPQTGSASSPAYLIKTHDGYEPRPITLPKGSVSQPPIIPPRKFKAPSPTSRTLTPSVQPSAPPDHASDKHKLLTPASSPMESHSPNIPLQAAHDLSPSAISPLAYGGAPDAVTQSNITRPAPSTTQSSNAKHSYSPAMSPSYASPINHEKSYSKRMPVSAPPKDHSSLVKGLNSKGSSPVISPMPQEVEEPSNVTVAPLASHSHYLGSSPMISPPPHEVKKPSTITEAPIASPPCPSGSSQVLSPMPQEKEPSSSTSAPVPSHPHPSVSSPMISPVSHEVNSPANVTEAPPASPPHSSESSQVISPSPQGKEEPSVSNNTPLASSPHSSGSSPTISPATHEVKSPSNFTQAPLASSPHPSRSSQVISPMPQVKKPSVPTSTPPASHSLPSGSSPAISPAPHEVKGPPIIREAPLASQLPLGSSPNMSPVPHNITHAPLPSHPHHSAISPVHSPMPQEANNSSNVTHASSPLGAHPSKHSPMISPMPREVKEPSNITHAPLASHLRPLVPSPVLSPMPHEMVQPSNTTNAPLPSGGHPSGYSPTISPAPHEAKKSSNITHSPLPSRLNPSVPSPDISPVPREKAKPSNIVHAPLASGARHSEYSPKISPMPHEVKKPSNITHAPLASHLHHSKFSPAISPKPHDWTRPANITHAPLASPPHPASGIQTPASTPTLPIPQHSRTRTENPAPSPFSSLSPSSSHPGTVTSPSPSRLPAVFPKNKQRHHASPPDGQGPSLFPTQAPSHPPAVLPDNKRRPHSSPPDNQAPYISPDGVPFHSKNSEVSHAPSPSSIIPSNKNKFPFHSPISSPSGSFSWKPRAPSQQPFWAFPPPPPNPDCSQLQCVEPRTYPPTGSVCVCVVPIKVGLRLSIPLYTFFPLVSELAQEIASGVFMKQSQVRIMGANADGLDPEKTIVIIYLVPLGGSFDSTAPYLTYEKFWHKQVAIQTSDFGDYDVLYVLYPGLPPSPPMAPTDASVGGGAYTDNNARAIRPFGVDVRKKRDKLSGRLIAIIVPISVIALVLSVGVAWLLLLKCRNRPLRLPPTSQTLLPQFAKSSVAGAGAGISGSGPSSTSASFSSNLAAYTGSAKTFSLSEIQKATDRFNESRIIGEGGFGRVYRGILEDGTMMAVKVLKRDDQQGGREFVAEVEMLCRLHHRNLVKLIGICTEDNVRCLVYELVPNGSVESHLHGTDKEIAPLDWNARMKIALGAARGLAYLHEDSSPRVIHRDFKSSNILLEHDFTPKVSDFGLARAAMEEGNEHISTRVMGTFGYVAPEYAMTGHLLVKSDVYSYGVVLLELLTGRKPVDMSRPPGQETLVSWARPLLTSMDGLQAIADPSLGADISSDSVAKVAAIASMCVQPEVSHRPFMGEVVQALKLVCNESDEHRRSESCSQDGSSAKDTDIRISTGLGPEDERMLSESDILFTPASFTRDASGSFRRYSSSGPLSTGRRTEFWQRVKRFSSGSMSEDRASLRLGTDLEGAKQWP